MVMAGWQSHLLLGIGGKKEVTVPSPFALDVASGFSCCRAWTVL